MIDQTMRDLAELLRMQEELAATIDALRDQLKAHMSAAGVDSLHGSEHKCSWKEVTTSRIDTTALKKALPDVAAQFTRQTTAKRFTFN